MNRRSTEVAGVVNFPVDNPRWKNTFEGGVTVKLVVCDDNETAAFAQCMGSYVVDIYSEPLVGDSLRPVPADSQDPDVCKAVQQDQAAMEDWTRYHYPGYGREGLDDLSAHGSRTYLAAMVLGSTGWSGECVDTHVPWSCALSDLTEQGRALYDMVVATYPGCSVHLLTFVDT